MKKTIATAMALLFLLGSICLFPSCRNNAEDAPDNGFLAEEDSEELENQDSIKRKNIWTATDMLTKAWLILLSRMYWILLTDRRI